MDKEPISKDPVTQQQVKMVLDAAKNHLEYPMTCSSRDILDFVNGALMTRPEITVVVNGVYWLVQRDED